MSSLLCHACPALPLRSTFVTAMQQPNACSGSAETAPSPMASAAAIPHSNGAAQEGLEAAAMQQLDGLNPVFAHKNWQKQPVKGQHISMPGNCLLNASCIPSMCMAAMMGLALLIFICHTPCMGTRNRAWHIVMCLACAAQHHFLTFIHPTPVADAY